MDETSILTSIKHLLGIEEDFTQFDGELIIFINAAFAELKELGVGPSSGFAITDKTAIWSTYIDDTNINDVKTFVYLKTKLIFDPPSNSFAVDAIERQITEYTWRLNVRFDVS